MATKRKNTSNKIGETFEIALQNKMDELLANEICMLAKVPTEWKVIRKGKYISSAFPVAESKFCDYIGTVDGKSVSIEAKTHAGKTSFPLANIKDSQYIYFINNYKFCGYGYYIIDWRLLDETYIVKASLVEEFRQTETRKSIPIQWFRENGFLLDNLNFIDYIKEDIKKGY